MNKRVDSSVEGTRLRSGRVALKEITNVAAKDRRKSCQVRRVTASMNKCSKRTTDVLPCATQAKKCKGHAEKLNCTGENKNDSNTRLAMLHQSKESATTRYQAKQQCVDINNANNFEDKCKLYSTVEDHDDCSDSKTDADKVIEKPILLLNLTEQYHEDIYCYMLALEAKSKLNVNHLHGKKITSKMRFIVVDWLFEVQNYFRLCNETVELTVALFDRCLANDSTIDQSNVQLVCIAALFIAVKYEETFILELSDLRYICDYSYQEKEILEMEIRVLQIIDFNLSYPSKTAFLGIILHKLNISDYILVEHLAKYFIDISLLDYNLVNVESSRIASASCYISLCVIRGSLLQTITNFTTYSILDLQKTILSIAKWAVSSRGNDKGGIFNKYFKENHGKHLIDLVQSQLYLNILKQICTMFHC